MQQQKTHNQKTQIILRFPLLEQNTIITLETFSRLKRNLLLSNRVSPSRIIVQFLLVRVGMTKRSSTPSVVSQQSSLLQECKCLWIFRLAAAEAMWLLVLEQTSPFGPQPLWSACASFSYRKNCSSDLRFTRSLDRIPVRLKGRIFCYSLV